MPSAHKGEKKMNDKKLEVYIRSDGAVFTEDGIKRLKAGGHKGFNRFKKNTEAQIGKWKRVCKPLDPDAAAIIKGVKGFVARAKFVSSAIIEEMGRRAKQPHRWEDRPKAKEWAAFMRLTLTDDAYWTIRPMGNGDFREFVSSAILNAAGKKGAK